jgi:hypothetical protein
MPLLGLLLITAGVISLTENPARYANSILPILAGLFFLFGLRVLARSSYRRDNRLPQTFEAVVSDSGVNVSSGTTSSRYAWNAFIRYQESKSLFLIYQALKVFNIVPKPAFARGEEESFRSIFSQKLGGSSSAHNKKISPRTWIFLRVVAASLVLLAMASRNLW